MFLKPLQDRNPGLIKTAVQLYESGELEANTYVLDLQTIRDNASVISERAGKAGLKVYGMTKQMGYNPDLHQAVVDSGIESFVAVDWMGARIIHEQGFKLGHVGHLVQAPKGSVEHLASMRPEGWTVFSLQKAQELNEAMKKIGARQNVLLRVFGDNPRFYPGHEGGFYVGDVVDAAREITKLSHVNIVGVTSFPCLLFDNDAKEVRPTVNFDAVIDAAGLLRKELGLTLTQINTPGTNSSDLFAMIAERGGTHVEPGHGLTGTTPLATVGEAAEKPAVLYLSEISHIYKGRGHVFGGGLYVDPVRGAYPVKALVGKDLQPRDAELIPAGGIDYYGYIDGDVREGDPVVFGFRGQVFFSNGQVAAVDGIREGKPVVKGYYDSHGNPIRRR